jgi:hypothetical protein
MLQRKSQQSEKSPELHRSLSDGNINAKVSVCNICDNIILIHVFKDDYKISGFGISINFNTSIVNSPKNKIILVSIYCI